MLQVEIWSDVVCPWCYLGKRRFEMALEQFPHRDEVEVIWRSFELDPDAPQQIDGTLDEMLARKYGMSVAQARAGHARLEQLGKEVGLDYRFDIARTGNTFAAHQLIHFAAAQGKQAEMKDRLMRAYFTEGQPISDPETLVALATEIGLDPLAVRTALDGATYAAEVRADERRASDFGISGVPYYVFDEHFAVSGAQSIGVFKMALDKAWKEIAARV